MAVAKKKTQTAPIAQPARAKTLKPTDRAAAKLAREAQAKIEKRRADDKRRRDARKARSMEQAEAKAPAPAMPVLAGTALDPMTLTRAELLAALKAHRITAMQRRDEGATSALTIAIALAELL